MVKIKIFTNGNLRWITPRDILAAILIIGCLGLKFMDKDGTVSLILVSVVAYYFSKRVYEEKLGA